MKALSPLIAGVLLIAITVTVAILVSAWTSSLTSSTQAGITNKSKEVVGCSTAAIDIDAVYIRGTGNATAVVKNTGLVDNLIIVSAQLYNNTGGNFSGSSLPISGFDRGEIASISFNNIIIGSSCPGNFSQLIVETNCPPAADTFDSKNEAPNCA